jgi:hypothetical protein
MHIVFGEDTAQELSKKYTLLEVDTVTHPEHGPLPAYCVLPVEAIALEMITLEDNVNQHRMVIDAIKRNEPALARQLCLSMTGKFGGEMDTFYEEIIKRIDSTGSTALPMPIST